jgi:pimeloyl-ACP methyl ester carboxylesterase
MGMTSGYADVNGLHLYYEVYADGEGGTPLVLLHGGMLTIDLNFASLIPALAGRYQVIGVETQGHGRTANIDRPITPANSASDVVGLLDHLGVDRAHVLGHSMGGATAMELAVSHPDRVRSVVAASITVRPDGMTDELSDPAKMATSTKMPTAQDMADMQAAYARLSPTPDQFNDFLQQLSTSTADTQGWTDEQLAGVKAPALLVLGDDDFTTIEHAALMKALIPGAQLLVLPGTTHMQVTRRADLLLPALTAFLD